MADDLFPDDGNEDNTDSTESNPVRQQRDEIDRLKDQLKEAKKREKEFEVLQAKVGEMETEKRKVTLESVFEKAELNPSWGEWYPSDAEVSPEKVKEWAESKGLARPSEAPVHQPLAGTGTPAGTGQSPVSMDDIMAAIKRGDDAFVERVAAEEADRPGRIAWKHPDQL